jgi:hypothetical protein
MCGQTSQFHFRQRQLQELYTIRSTKFNLPGRPARARSHGNEKCRALGGGMGRGEPRMTIVVPVITQHLLGIL